MRQVTVVTTSRADYGIYKPVLRRLMASPAVELGVLVSGSHLAPSFGATVREIEEDGFPITDRVESLVASESAEGVAKSMGLACIGFGQVYSRRRPDLLVVLGDRFEMHSAALAAVPFLIPVAHIHGGETSFGAIDESFRHSMTKLSHLHFVASEEACRRVVQMGEEPWRVTVSGAPSLDSLGGFVPMSEERLERKLGKSLPEGDLLVVTFHPATLDGSGTLEQTEALIQALDAVGLAAVITLPNADPAGWGMRELLAGAAAVRENWVAVDNLGTEAYFTLLGRAAAMVGNSSSGLIEAPSFGLPVVNVGRRQEGRMRGRNVLDVEPTSEGIEAGLRTVLCPVFREGLRGMENPYGDGKAAGRIVRRLESEDLGDRLLRKRFYDLAGVSK